MSELTPGSNYPLCKESKQLSLSFAKRNGMNVLPSFLVSSRVSESEVMRRLLANGMRFPVIAKMDRGHGSGKGITVCNSPDEIVIHAREYGKSLIETFLNGSLYRHFRLYVLEGEAADLVERIPLKVVGDGHSTIRTLIIRKGTMITPSHLPSLDPIVEKGVEVVVNGLHNNHAGAEIFYSEIREKHHELTKKIKNMFSDKYGLLAIDFIQRDGTIFVHDLNCASPGIMNSVVAKGRRNCSLNFAARVMRNILK